MPTLSLWIDSRLEEVARLGAAVDQACREQGATAEQAYEVELAVCEVVNNIIRHARSGPGERVSVLLTVNAQGARIEIPEGCTKGMVLHAGDAPAPERIEDLPEGGMGLGIIQATMDRVRCVEAEGRMLLILEKRFTPGDEAA